MSIEDKIFKAQQKADALADSFTENDPILARSEALKNKLVFDQLAKMSNPRVSLVDKLYSMGETQQRIQGIEEQEKAYKINKIADPTRYDNSYVDEKTGEVKKYSDLINYDREIEDYSLWGATKNAATRGTAELLQGGGKILQSATNGLGMLGEMGLQALDDITSPHNPNRFNSKDYKDIINKWDNNTIGALGVANALAKPLNETAKKINYKNLSSTDDIHQAFSEGIWDGTKELGSAIAHTLIGSAPEVAPALFGVVPGVLAGASSFMSRADKERQAKALGVSPDDIMEVSSNMTPEDLIGGAIYGGLNLVDASILKNAIGKGLISKLSDNTIGLSSKADNATKNAFAKLRESSPSLDAWLKPQGAGAKAVAWSADKAWKLGKTTGKVGGKVGIAAGLEGGAEMGQTLMEQWANGDLKDRSWDENWKDIKEAGLMGAYVGGSLKAPHAVYQEGKGKLESAFNSKKETKALEKYTPAANKALAGGNTLFDKLDDEKFAENLSKEDIENYKADFNDIVNSSPDASIDDINNFLNDENNRDAVIKTIYLAKNGKLGGDAAKSIIESHNNLVNTILSDSNPNEAILNSKSILEKIMYAVNLRDTNFVRGLFNSAISKSNKDILNSPENARNEVAKTLETYIAIMENLRDTLSKGIEQTKSLLGNTYSETKDKASLAYMDKMINTVKKTPTQVGMEIIKSGFTTMDGNKKESVSDYMDFLNKTNDIGALRNKKTKLETYRNNHRAKVALYQFLKNSKPIKQGNIAVIPRFSTNPNDIRVMSKQEFENELKRTNTSRNHFTIFESRFSNPKSYQTSVENLLNYIQNELDIMEQTYSDYEYKINRVSKQNTQNTTDNSSNKQDSKSNEKPKQSSTQSKQESKESETKSENKKSSNDSVTQEERIKQEKVKLSNQENTNIDDDTPPFDPDPKPSEVKGETKPEQTSTGNFEQTIDIYSTNKDKWSYLTNVTKSPLVLNIGGQEYKFVSVEHAYQTLKHNDFSKPMSEWTPAKVYKANWNNAIKIRSELKENRENGSNLKIMKYLLEERVKQDSKFKKLLKETGNATLTHNKDNTIWKDKFPELLMEIRNELNSKNEQENISNSNNKTTPVNDIIKSTSLNDFTSLQQSFKKLREIYQGKTQGEAIEKMCEALGKYKIGRDFLQALLDMKVVHGNSPKSVEAIQNTLNQYKNQENTHSQSIQTYTGKITNNEPNTIFVFGSNIEGKHGLGAAKIARDQFGAIYGQSEGLQGNSYAIPTKDLSKGTRSISKEQIINSIKEMYKVARNTPSKVFKIAYMGTDKNNEKALLSGYTNKELADMFVEASKEVAIPSNVQFSFEWVNAGFLNGINTDTNINQNTQTTQNKEVIPSSNVEQEVSNQNTIANIVNFVKPKTIEKDTLTPMFNKLKEIKNGNELIKKVLTYGKALSNFIKENKNSKSQIATMGDITEIANKINREFSSIKQGFFYVFFTAVRGNKNNGGELPGILGEIQDNYANKNNIYNTPTELFQLNNYISVKIKESKNGTPFAEISTAPGATLLHDNRTVLSMAIRGIETLITLQFNKSRYMNNEEMTEHLQKVFGKDLNVNLEYPILKTLNEYSLENSLLLDMGRNIIKDLGLEFNQDTTGKEQESFIAQELGAYTINALEKIGFIDRTSLKNIDIFTDSEKPLAQLNLIKIKDDVFSKDATNENSTKNILEKLTNICEELKIDRNQSRVAYKFGKGFGELDNREHKTTKGKLKKLYKKAAKSLQISRNTKFVAKSRGYLLDFFERNNITLDTINKASEGYTPNLDEKLENLDKLNETDTILLSEIESKKGKNLGIENENSYMWDMIHDERSESEGVFFDFRLSKNEREFMQSDGINPQSQKISRFLLVPEALFTTYTKGSNGEILYQGKEDNIAYQHIAQAFGMGTDKAVRADSIAFGKSIVALDFNKLEKTMAEAMKKGKIEFEVDGIELSIAELGHALSALSALSKFHNAKAGENFEAAILGEADGINNGIAIKLLQYMLHPQYIELLRGTGIDFVKQASDKISDYFAGKVDDEEILDLYQTVAKDFNEVISKRAENIEDTRDSTLNNLKENDAKLANLINKEGNAINHVIDNITKSLVDIYKETDDGKVSKSSRNATKPIVQVFGYGAGDEAQINGLISSLMEKVERGALDYINGKSKNAFYYNILHAVYYLVTRKQANKENIKNALIHGIEVKKQNKDGSTETYKTTLLSAKIEGTSVNGYYIIKSILKEQLQSTIKNTMMSTFPGIREQSQLINEITNQRISLVQKSFELKKEEKLKNSSKDYLTIRELKEIQDELRKDLPGITLSIAEKDELNDIEAKHYFENIKEKTSETTGSQIFLDNRSKKSLTINPKENVYLDNGAGTNVIAIHQKDGSTILLTVVETVKKNDKGLLQRTFLGVHDAVVVGSHNAIKVQQTMNKIALEMDMKSKQLEEFKDIAKGNIEIAKKLGEENTIVLETMAQIQEIFATISNFNRSMLGKYSVSYNNIQNGNEGSAYTNIVKNALNPEKEGQNFNDTLIDFSFISSRLDDRLSNVQLPELLDLFNSNKMIIQRLSNKETLSENDAKKLAKALVAMNDISEGLKEYRKKLDKVINEKQGNLSSIQTNTKNKIDENIEIPFNTKYENVINAITRAINRNNIEGIKEAHEAVNGNEKGFRTAINKYLNSLDNMSESYKTNFKNKIKEALNIDIDKKLSGNKKAREEIEENITDENLKEALNKEIDNIEQTELMNSTNDEFKDFKQFNNVLNSPENKNNKNKLNSVENTEQNNNDTETTAIPILDDIQNNPNAISEMQDNLRDLDKQNGRSIDEEHSNILKEVLNKVTGTLSQSVGNLKVLLSHTNATNNAGEYNREINAITIKHSTNPRYSGYMGAELTYAHEMIHAATSFAVRYMQGNNKFTHMLRTAYDLFLHNANAETIAEHLTQIPNIQERHRIANMLFNYITKNEDSLTNLEEFLAIALTDKAMIEILQSIPYKEESKTLFQKIRDTFFEIFDTIFGDNILKVKKNGSTYDMLVSLAAQMGKINQNAKNEVTKNKSKLREIIDFAREEMNEKLSGVISTSLTPVKKFLVKEMATNTSDSWLGHIRYHAASGVLAMCSKDYQDNLRKELSDTYIALNNDTMLGAIIDDISTPSAMARLAQRAQRESSRIDAKRESYEYFTEQTLKNFFKNPISEYEAQAMGEVFLDMDIASLDMDINDIQSLLSNEAMLNDKIKEFKNKINNKNLDQKYKNYIHNRSIALAYKMVTGKNIDNAVALNAYNIVNGIGTNARYGNPIKKFDTEFKNKLVKDVDQYITLLALKLMDKGTKESVANVINKDLKATEKVMNFIKNFNKNSQKDLFKDNKIQTIKGYRRDVYNNDKEIIWADASREKELAKEGYKRISKPLSKNASDNTNDTRCMYVNTFISKQTNFTRQAIRYTKGTSRGHELRDLINHEIYENPERVNELERLYHKSMAEAKENFKRDISRAMNTEIPLDIKILENMSKETNLQPILDEVGNVASFSYQMSKEVKKDVLALNTNIFKSLGKMQANYYDKNASRDLNNRIVEILVNDYKVASKNPLELDKMFIELSHDTKDPLKREIYKMLDYETRTKLEKEMGGKIMIRKDTFAKFFGVRDMDVRNAKWFKKMSNVEVKKTIIFTAELLKMITKLFKLETVVRTPSVFIANQVSNIWQCMNYGIPLLDSLKLHREAVANLRRYQEGRRKLIELELKVSAGEKVNEASINALRASLKNNPVYPLVAHGFLNTIIEDLDKPAKGYFEEKYSEFYNNRSSVGKGIIDWAFLTEKTFVGKALTEYVHMADFLSRYTLYYGLKNQGKLNETQIIDEVSDAFIDYDMITNRGIKMLNDYGFALFTRFFTRSQRLLKNHLVDRPFTTAALLVTQSHVGDAFNDSVYDTVFWNKNYGYMLGLANPIYNAIDVLSPSGLKFIPGMSDVMSTASLRNSSMFI